MPTIPTRKDLSVNVPYANTQHVYVPDISGPGRGLERIGAEIAGLGFEQKRKDDALELIKAEAEQRSGLNEISRSLKESSDYSAYKPEFDARVTDLTERTASMLPEHMRESWKAKAALENEAARESVLNHGDVLKKRDQEIQLEDSLKKHYEAIADIGASQADRDIARKSLIDSIDLATKSGLVTPAQRRRLSNDYLSGAYEQVVRQRIAAGDDIKSIIRDINGTAKSGPMSAIDMTGYLESGKSDWREGLKNITVDTGGLKSYGNIGLYAKKSLKDFVETYKDKFGFTANVGSKEFDRQWLAAAQNKPDELHQAEIEWYNANISPGIKEDLTSVGVPKDIADNPVVLNYFADRRVQQGPESIKKHADRIKSALGYAEGDAASFLSQMSASDAESIETDFKSYLATVPKSQAARERAIVGLRNRITGREQMSQGIEERGGMYPDLTPKQRSVLINVAKTAYHESALNDLRNSVTEARRTGNIPVGPDGSTAIDRAREILNPNQLKKYQLQILGAGAEYHGSSRLSEMSDGEARAWIDGLNPTFHDSGASYPLTEIDPNEHYSIAMKAHDVADANWRIISNKRERDPAGAVEGFTHIRGTSQSSYAPATEIVEARRRIKQLGSSLSVMAANELMLDARLAAQNRLKIPKVDQQVLTEAEAKQLLQLPHNATVDDIDNAMPIANKRAVATYGRYAEEALKSAISLLIKAQTNQDEARMLINTKPDAKPKDSGSWLDSIMSVFGAGSKNKPQAGDVSQKQIEAIAKMVQERPDSLKQIEETVDKQFGPGTFSKIVGNNAGVVK